MADLVVKSNKLVQALQTLTLSETRLLQLAIVDARETGQGLSAEEPLELNASRYATAFNVSPDAAYLALVEAEDSLFKRQFTITNEDGTLTKSRWIQDALNNILLVTILKKLPILKAFMLYDFMSC